MTCVDRLCAKILTKYLWFKCSTTNYLNNNCIEKTKSDEFKQQNKEMIE